MDPPPTQRLHSTPVLHPVTATAARYTLSLHDALPIWQHLEGLRVGPRQHVGLVHPGESLDRRAVEADALGEGALQLGGRDRSEEHTSELQSRRDLVCRLLLEKKNTPHSVALVGEWAAA